MSKAKHFYFYKTTNTVNGKIYYGVHSTSNIEDGYLGSGKYLKRAIRKYGKDKFTREIILFFDSPQDMYDYEKYFVTLSIVNSQKTYNLRLGGKGGFDHINSKPRSWTFSPEAIEFLSKKAKTQWLNLTASQKHNAVQVLQDSNKRWQKGLSPSERKVWQESLQEAQAKFWTSNAGDKARVTMQGKARAFWDSKRGITKRQELSMKLSGYKNPAFIKQTKPYYDEHRDDIIHLAAYSNMPDRQIIRYLSLNGKIDKIFSYYQHRGWLTLDDVNMEYDVGWQTRIKKTVCYTPLFNAKYQHYKILQKDFFTQFDAILELIFTDAPDSYIKSQFAYYNQFLKYGQYLHIFKIDDIVRVNIKSYYPNSKRLTSPKTYIAINRNFTQDYKLVSKGDYAEHKITQNGRGFSVSRC